MPSSQPTNEDRSFPPPGEGALAPENIASQKGAANEGRAGSANDDTHIYGSFSLAGAEFAVSARWLQEVVNEPAAYSTLPLSPDYLLGVFDLRGDIVPVIDLRKILRLDTPDDATGVAGKVAIIEYGQWYLGLVFDTTGEVFNGNDLDQCLFEARDHTAAGQVIEGVFKARDSGRMTQILDVPAMLQLESVPHCGKVEHRNRPTGHGKRCQCIAFRLGTSRCALDIAAIREIVTIGSIDNTVLSSELCLGAIDIRGDTVPVVNLERLLSSDECGAAAPDRFDAHRVIVVTIGKRLLGLLVDSIEDTVSYGEEELIDFPVLATRRKTAFRGCIPSASDESHTILLQHDDLFSRDELDAITRGHSQLFSGPETGDDDKGSSPADRKTLITFSLGHRYGISITDVREVIDYPEHLVRAPDMAEHLRGMVHLRGELVAIIDLHALYRLPYPGDRADSKILIFEHGGHKHGLVVDSVDSIVQYNRNDVVKVPTMVSGEDSGTMAGDVLEALRIKTHGREQTVCVLDLDAIVRRADAA